VKIIGLGTNLGDKTGNLLQAVVLMSQRGITPIKLSSIYQTPPWGDLNQDEFLNMVVEVEWAGSPEDLLANLLSIEQEMGRIRERKWGPRLIDMDIVLFDDLTLESPDLQIPHPYYLERVFVVAPFAELYPHFIPVGSSASLAAMLEKMDTDEIEIYAPQHP